MPFLFGRGQLKHVAEQRDPAAWQLGQQVECREHRGWLAL